MMLHDAGCPIKWQQNNCFVTMPIEGVYKLQKRFADKSNNDAQLPVKCPI